MNLFPFVLRRTYQRDLTAARLAEQWALDRANDAELDAERARSVQRFQIDQRADATTGLEAAKERYRAAERRIATLEKQLDDAMGMDDPGIAMGAGWQARRTDKAPAAPKLATGAPSGLLPRREPGVVDA